ncbi:hypothetical protein ABVT39_025368 [Epinephelus coioides]
MEKFAPSRSPTSPFVSSDYPVSARARTPQQRKVRYVSPMFSVQLTFPIPKMRNGACFQNNLCLFVALTKPSQSTIINAIVIIIIATNVGRVRDGMTSAIEKKWVYEHETCQQGSTITKRACFSMFTCTHSIQRLAFVPEEQAAARFCYKGTQHRAACDYRSSSLLTAVSGAGNMQINGVKGYSSLIASVMCPPLQCLNMGFLRSKYGHLRHGKRV